MTTQNSHGARVSAPAPPHMAPVANEIRPPRRVVLKSATTVKARPVKWLLEGWIPAATLTLIAGREGIGKSTVTADLVARATRGDLDGQDCPARVIVAALEDSRSMVTVPRLIAAGAVLERVDFIDLKAGDMPGRLELPRDTEQLATVVEESGASLLVLDPMTAVMSSRLNPNTLNDVRAMLDPLAMMASRKDCTVVGVVHHNKSATGDSGRAINGSGAWSHVPRSVISCAADEARGDLVISVTKSNLGGARPSIAARVETATAPGGITTSRLVATGDTDRSALDLMDSRDDDNRATRMDVDRWLKEILAVPRFSAEILKQAPAAGYSADQTRRARVRLGIKSTRVATSWVWHLDGMDPAGAQSLDIPTDMNGATPDER